MSENQSNVLPFISLEERKTKINEAISNMEPEAQFNLIKKMFPGHDVIQLENGHVAVSNEPIEQYIEYTDEQLELVKVGAVFSLNYIIEMQKSGVDLNHFFEDMIEPDYTHIIDEIITMHLHDEDETPLGA